MTVHSQSCSLYNRQLQGAAYASIRDGKALNWPRIHFHLDEQDTSLPGWAALQQLIEDAAKDKRETFSPRGDLGHDLWSQVVTLPESIKTLKSVKVFDLYGSPLIRIPPEIGKMDSLEEFDPYTSYGLHWYPFEITQCKSLKKSRVSTRALYGNFKFRPGFPSLSPTVPQLVPKQCSVCGGELAQSNAYQRWLSLRVATDVLPLLVNACSEACISTLPAGADGYIASPHTGGPDVRQPTAIPGYRTISVPPLSGESGSTPPDGSAHLQDASKLPLLHAKVPPWKAEEFKKK